jgi:DNA modification methylase
MQADTLSVVYVSTDSIQPRVKNPRTHSKKQIRQIAASLQTFGFTNPILVDEDGRILAGHGRLAAAKLLKIDKVPTIRLDQMTEEQKRAYVLADNKLALNAGWDQEILAHELQALVDLNFDVSLTGFEPAEVDLTIDGLDDTKPEQPAPLPHSGPPVAQLGDLWQLGKHRLYCGDSLFAESYDSLMGGDQAALVFTDPPYNVPIAGHVSGLGKVEHKEFAMASGEMTEAEFTAFLHTIFNHLTRHSADGSIHFVAMDWRHMGEVLSAADGIYSELKNLCVWRKTNAGMGSLYRSQHELVFVFKNGTEPHINNVELGKHGRYRTNVWDYAGVNTFKKDRAEELAMHPTVKPVALVADAIKDCSKRGAIVLDPFGGSGSTLIAAEQTGRCAYLIEIDPAYVDVIIRRWQAATGKTAMHSQSGQSFAQREAERGIPPNPTEE